MRIVLSYIRNSGINSKWSCCNGILRLCSVMSTSLTVPIMRQGSRYGWECLFDPSLSRYASPNSGVIISRQINPNFSLDFHKTKVTYNETRQLIIFIGWVRLFNPSLNRYVSPNPRVFQSRQINPNFFLEFHKTKVTYNETRQSIYSLVGYVYSIPLWTGMFLQIPKCFNPVKLTRISC